MEPIEEVEEVMKGNEENKQELSLYQKLALNGSPRNKNKDVKDSRLNKMPMVLNDMVN